jgi:hypothetical protein
MRNARAVFVGLLASLSVVDYAGARSQPLELLRKVSNETQIAPAPPAIRSVLVMAGRNLTPSYGDARYDQVWFEYSSSFVDAVRNSLDLLHVPVHVNTNRDRRVKASDEVARLLGERSYDAVIQVTITHVKNAVENTVYLEAEYFRVRYGSENGRRSVTFEGRQAQKYPVLGEAGQDMRDVPAARLAEQFIDALKTAGVFQP